MITDSYTNDTEMPAFSALVVTPRRPIVVEVSHYAAGNPADDDEDGTPSRSGNSAGGGASGRRQFLTEAELAAIEALYARGITAVQIVDAFTSRGIKFSEASFRKYVQQGLLPRSRRVGRKGKYRGSLGVYPAKAVRRINSIKRLMVDGYTIEEISAQFLPYTTLVDSLGEVTEEILARLEAEVLTHPERRNLEDELDEVRRLSDELSTKLGELARRVTAPRAERTRLSGAAGSAEELL